METTNAPSTSYAHPVKMSPVRIGCALLAILVIGCLFIFPARPPARDAARRMQCSNNLHNIALALQNYYDDHGSFPPAYIAAADGKPIHSWRVVLLPYLGQEDLYAKYSFDEPWNGPNNSKLHDRMLKIFRCPSQPEKQPRVHTSYLAVVGQETM